jgi:hypothetical protein
VSKLFENGVFKELFSSEWASLQSFKDAPHISFFLFSRQVDGSLPQVLLYKSNQKETFMNTSKTASVVHKDS